MWGKGKSSGGLAAKLRADPGLKEREAKRKAKMEQQKQDRARALDEFEAVHPAHVHAHHHYTRLASDGCVHPPAVVRLQENATAMVCVLLVDSTGERVLLSRKSEEGGASASVSASSGQMAEASKCETKDSGLEGKNAQTQGGEDDDAAVEEDGFCYYAPVTEILPNSGGLHGTLAGFDLIRALHLTTQTSEVESAADTGSFDLVAVENYPSYSTNWVRYCVTATVASAWEERAEEIEGFKWQPMDKVIDGKINLGMYVCVYVCMCVCMYVRERMYVCMHMCAYIYLPLCSICDVCLLLGLHMLRASGRGASGPSII
jgi:hypothetical protein